MMHWIIRFLLCSLLLMPFGRVKAQNEEPVSKVQLEYKFGESIQVTAEIANSEDFSSILLILRPDGQSSRQVAVTPQSNGRVNISYDLTIDPLHPFARVYYWFELTESDGSTLTTSSYWFDYLDDRYQWQSSTTDLFEIYWVEGEETFGQKVQEIAREGLKTATNLLPVTPSLPIRIYVYPDVNTLQQTLTLTRQPWTAGHASPDIGVILVSNGSQSAELIEMERQIPHELMHILEYQLTGESYTNIPVWLNEGLATSAELYPNPDLQRVLNEAQGNGLLLSTSSLCAGFPQDAINAQIAYAQSASFITYLNGRFGAQVFSELIKNASSGQTCENAVESATTFTIDQLERDWLSSILNNTSPVPINFGILTVVISAGVIGVVMLILLLRRRHLSERQ